MVCILKDVGTAAHCRSSQYFAISPNISSFFWYYIEYCKKAEFKFRLILGTGSIKQYV